MVGSLRHCPHDKAGSRPNPPAASTRLEGQRAGWLRCAARARSFSRACAAALPSFECMRASLHGGMRYRQRTNARAPSSLSLSPFLSAPLLQSTRAASSGASVRAGGAAELRPTPTQAEAQPPAPDPLLRSALEQRFRLQFEALPATMPQDPRGSTRAVLAHWPASSQAPEVARSERAGFWRPRASSARSPWHRELQAFETNRWRRGAETRLPQARLLQSER